VTGCLQVLPDNVAPWHVEPEVDLGGAGVVHKVGVDGDALRRGLACKPPSGLSGVESEEDALGVQVVGDVHKHLWSINDGDDIIKGDLHTANALITTWEATWVLLYVVYIDTHTKGRNPACSRDPCPGGAPAPFHGEG